MPVERRASEVEFAIAADFPSVRAGLGKVRTVLLREGLSVEEVGTVEIVLAEVLNNVVEHAFGNRTGGEVRLGLRLSSRGLMVEVTDRGAEMPDGKPPIGLSPSPGLEPATVPEGGYGWFMIRELTRDVTYSRSGGINRLAFRIVVGLDLCLSN